MRISKIGFEMRHFLSECGKFIYTVVYANNDSLKLTAELDKFPKEINFELSDIFSLEPVDGSLRPMRLNPFLKPDFFLEDDGDVKI